MAMYEVACLSPVHVGTGTSFSGLDGVYKDGRWHRIDLDRVLASGAEARQLARQMSMPSFTWREWLAARPRQPSDISAYALPCPQDPGDTPIREFVKDPYGQPYLPGSSVKGALRTAVLWHLLGSQLEQQTFTRRYLSLCIHARPLVDEMRERRGFDSPRDHVEAIAQALHTDEEEARACLQVLYRVLKVQEAQLHQNWMLKKFRSGLERLGRTDEWLGQPVEQAVLGQDPNHDLMRAVQVSDAAAVSLEQLAVGLAWTYTLHNGWLEEKRDSQGEYKIFIEWLVPGTQLRLQIRLDEFLFKDAANRVLHLRGAREEAVRHIDQTCNAFARRIISAEKAFYSEHGLDQLADFYAGLANALNSLPAGAFLLNIGWGSGWEIKTVGDLVGPALGEDGFRALRERYRLGENPRTRQIYLDAPFPKTRHIAYEAGAARWAMGWVQVTPGP